MRLEAEEWVDRGDYKVSKLCVLDEKTFIQLVSIDGRVGEHYHKIQTEVFVIVKGSGVIGINNRIFEVECGDVLLCKPRNIHFAEGKMEILVFKYDYAENDTVWLKV